ITAPDNDHLHNRLHRFYRQKVKSRNLANSLTGLSIACATSGGVFIIYLVDGISLTSHNWWFIFLSQAVAYGALFFSLRSKPIPA
ncbi:hypothetical protein N9L66_02980, partial [Porticoccaceae bacterium]|nr:hypothetical protein [Porticoccaceae bacterium]